MHETLLGRVKERLCEAGKEKENAQKKRRAGAKTDQRDAKKQKTRGGVLASQSAYKTKRNREQSASQQRKRAALGDLTNLKKLHGTDGAKKDSKPDKTTTDLLQLKRDRECTDCHIMKSEMLRKSPLAKGAEVRQRGHRGWLCSDCKNKPTRVIT